MKYQRGLEADNQAWGSSLWGSGSQGLRAQDSNLVEEADGGLARATAALQYLPPFSPGFGENSSVFSPIHFFPPPPPPQQQQQQQHLQAQTSGLNCNWQSLLGGQSSLLQSQASLQRFTSGADQGLAPLSSFLPQLHQESNQVGEREADGDGTSDLSLGEDSDESEGSSDGALDRSSKRKRKSSKSRKAKETNARRSKGASWTAEVELFVLWQILKRFFFKYSNLHNLARWMDDRISLRLLLPHVSPEFALSIYHLWKDCAS